MKKEVSKNSDLLSKHLYPTYKDLKEENACLKKLIRAAELEQEILKKAIDNLPKHGK